MSNEEVAIDNGRTMMKRDMNMLAAELKALSEAKNDEEAAEQSLKRFKDVGIERKGTKMILPDGMTLATGIKMLERRMTEEETEVSIIEDIEAFPLDGAYALATALERIYGWSNLVPTPGFFRNNPPNMVGVQCAYNKKVQVPWGRIIIPGISGFIQTSYFKKDGRIIFRLMGTVKRKHEKHIAELAEIVRKIIEKESIYRGKAIRINYRDPSGDRMEDNFDNCPKFIDCSKIKPEEVVFSDDVAAMINTCLFNPIRYSDKCRNFKIPLKRGILLEGPFGTGKTLTAWSAAKLCEENEWTFIYLEDCRDLDLAIEFASLYQPAMIFAEDIDRAITQERNSGTDRILNTLDGITSKHRELIVVLTSNAVEKIHGSFLRPGRVDTVIKVEHPDVKAMSKLVRLYGRELVDATDEELLSAVEPLKGTNAAAVREAVERAKLASLSPDSDTLRITAEGIKIAAESLRQHMDYLKPIPAEEPDPIELLADKFQGKFRKEFTDERKRIEETHTMAKQIKSHVC